MAPTLSSKRTRPVVSTPQPVNANLGACPLPVSAWVQLRDVWRLSDRELRVAQGIFDEQEQDSIARTSGLPTEVVYRTTQRIYIKLHVGSRRELISLIKSEYLALATRQVVSERTLRAG